MQIGVCRVRINQFTDVPKLRVTPAELVVLTTAYGKSAGTDPIFDLKVVGEVKRSSDDELERLKRQYGGLKNPDNKKQSVIDALFTGHAFKLPMTFEQLGNKYTNLPTATVEESKPKNYLPGNDDKFIDPEFDKEEVAPVQVEQSAPAEITEPLPTGEAPAEPSAPKRNIRR